MAETPKGLAKPMNLSAELEEVVGKGPMPRTEVTKKIWEYIKKNDLQDPANRRNINADDKLKPIFGGKAQVSMFEMTKLVSTHLT
jgi:upstream activation factor subunit UAF30